MLDISFLRIRETSLNCVMDFLSLLESDTEVAVSDETALQQQESDKLVAVQNFPRTTSQGDFQRRAVFPSLKGRVGKGRHGLYAERALLACHMRTFFELLFLL